MNIEKTKDTDVKLISGEWKHSLDVSANNSIASLVSIWDLVYDKDGTKWIDHPNLDDVGIKLEHDIICLNNAMFKPGGYLNDEDDFLKSTWTTYGIDLSLPFYDSRAKQISIENTQSISSKKVFPSDSYYLYDKDSIRAPSDIINFTNRGALRDKAGIEGGSNSPSVNNYKRPEITTFENSNYREFDIILSHTDNSFNSTLSIQDNFKAFNKIFINPNRTFYAVLLYKLLGFNSLLYGEAFAEIAKNGRLSTANLRPTDIEIIDSPKNGESSLENPLCVKDAINSKDDPYAWERLLKNTFVWIRCPFFGDYIEPKSFNQDLTQDAKVIHNEIMISGAGDFKKYDEFVGSSDKSSLAGTIEKGSSEETQPYIPITSPTVDFYTSKFLDNNFEDIREAVSDGNYSSKLQNVSNLGIDEFFNEPRFVNNPIVKGLPITPINRHEADHNNSNAKSLVPPNYFDSETRNFNDTYKEMGKFPTVLPKDGNAYFDGRIISPTIDELWYMIKKLVSGRKSDVIYSTESGELANVHRAQDTDSGIPYGDGEEFKNNTDTSMTEVPDSEFYFSYTNEREQNKETKKIGDPIGYKYSQDFNNIDSVNSNSLVITKFINQNNSIVYPVFRFLKDISEKVTTFDSSEEKVRGICNFTAWNIETWGSSERSSTVKDNETISNGVWSPRKVPYSLRELEALGLSNKYNLITLARFIQNNFGITGGLGIKKTGETDTWNNVAGSLYQFHKSYNYSVDNPNSYFSNNGTVDGLPLDGSSELVGINVEKSYTLEEGSNLIIKEEYNKGIPDNQNIYSSSDVYLAADGSWRYVNEHIRLPILKCEY